MKKFDGENWQDAEITVLANPMDDVRYFIKALENENINHENKLLINKCLTQSLNNALGQVEIIRLDDKKFSEAMEKERVKNDE